MAYVVGALVVVYAGWGLFLLFMQSRLLYSPISEVSFTPADVGLDFEEVVFESEDGLQLSGWYLPAEQDAPTVLYCHGNGGNIMHCLDGIKMFHDLGLNCFIFDYRGYGRSKGKPSEEGTYRDVRAAYNWLTGNKQLTADEIIVFGRSLGGTIAAYLASQVPVGGLVIESAFTSYPDIGQKLYPYFPVRLFARFKYSTIEYLSHVSCPLMLIYSKDDEIVPFEFGLRLYESAKEPKEFIEISGGHNDCFLASADIYKNAWVRWLDSLGGNRTESRHRVAS